MAIQRKVLDCFAALAMTVLLLWASPAAAQNFPEHGGSPVVDQAGLLRPEQVFDLKSKSEALYAQTGRSFVIATVKSLEGYPIEDYAYRLGRHWKLGDEKRDDGVILLVAPNERKVWIATGYGAEGFLPDILAGRITRDVILPRFRDGDMGGGIVAGADAIVRQMSLPAEEARANVAKAEQQQRSSSRGVDVRDIIPAIIIAIIFFSIIGSLSRRSRGRRYRPRHGAPGISPWIVLWGLNELSRGSRGRGGWSGGGWGGSGSSWGGGGGGGGFGGFGGGGSFGGGGAGGSW